MMQGYRYNKVEKNDLLFVWALLMNLLLTGIRESIHITQYFEDLVAEARGNLSCFVILGVLIIVPGAVECLFFYTKSGKLGQKIFSLAKMWLELIFISLSYYIGDNLYQTLRTHGEHICCFDKCKKASRTASLVFLGTATVASFILPQVFERISKHMKSKDSEVKSKKLMKIVKSVTTDV